MSAILLPFFLYGIWRICGGSSISEIIEEIEGTKEANIVEVTTNVNGKKEIFKALECSCCAGAGIVRIGSISHEPCPECEGEGFTKIDYNQEEDMKNKR